LKISALCISTYSLKKKVIQKKGKPQDLQQMLKKNNKRVWEYLEVKMFKKYLILIIPLVALIAVGIFSGSVYPLGHANREPFFTVIGGTVIDCNYCHDFENGVYDEPLPPNKNLRWVKTQIEWPPESGNLHDVKFTKLEDLSQNPDGTLADGKDALLDGPCEVCHTQTAHHTNTPDVGTHYDGQNCTAACHPHFLDDIQSYFQINFVGGQSHNTHFEDLKGPQLGTDSCFIYCHKSASNFKIFKDNQPLATTTQCDTCHSSLGSFNGVGTLGTCSSTARSCNEDTDCPTGETCVADPDSVAYGAKYNWEHGVYEKSDPEKTWPDVLKNEKDKWCAGCHDDVPAVVNEVSAPKVMGDNSVFGYYVSGHGRPDIGKKCKYCHVFDVSHTDGNDRTYEAALNNYQEGYRLKLPMIIPRHNEADPFELCMGCHFWTDLTGPDSGFRYDKTYGSQDYLNLHKTHLEPATTDICWDSDWNETDTNCNNGECADSAMSCTACHNVHGSPMLFNGIKKPSPPMIRHGELIATPGYSKEPALHFRWKDKAGNRVLEVDKSWWGGLFCGIYPDLPYNHVCWTCHDQGLNQYYRAPGKLYINKIWTTDLSDNPKTTFKRCESIRYHVYFTIIGQSPLYLVNANWTAKNLTGSVWNKTFNDSQTIEPGGFYWTWDSTIPTGASSPSDAKIKVTIDMRNQAGDTLIVTKTSNTTFKVLGSICGAP
jgi:hypothetical protein